MIAFRQASADLLKKRPTPSPAAARVELDASAVAKLFEEVKVMFRQLPDQVELSLERRLRRSQLAPMGSGLSSHTIEELYNQLIKSTIGDHAPAWLQLAQLAETYVPIVAKPLHEMYRAWRAGDVRRIHIVKRLILSRLEGVETELRRLPPDVAVNLKDLEPALRHLLETRLDLPDEPEQTKSKDGASSGKRAKKDSESE